MEVAKLEFGVNSKPVAAANTELDKFSKSTASADTKLKGFNNTAKAGSSIAAAMGRSLGIMAAGLFSVAAARGAIKTAREFNAAMSEASTLISGTVKEMAEMEKGARKLSNRFGGSATKQIEAYYQAISAGVGGVTEATALLDTANRLSIGGVTGVTTAVDILTTAINNYGAENLSATDTADALFVGVKAGKTTMNELAAALGNVLPFSSALNISFDETVAATAALTKGGLSTSQAVTGLRAAMVSVIGPSQQAKDLAKKLGIEFNVAGLESKGLAGFMQEVVEKTGGSAESMRLLFSSTEATTAAMALAGNAGGFLGEILGDMKNKAGAADEAFQKISKELDQRMSVALAKIGNVGLTIGQALLTVVVPAMEGFAAAMEFAANNGDLLVSILIGLAATQIPAMVVGLATMATGLNIAAVAMGALSVATKAFGVALRFAGGPLGVILSLLAGSAAYFGIFRKASDESDGSTETFSQQLEINRVKLINAASATKAYREELIALIATQQNAASAEAERIGSTLDNITEAIETVRNTVGPKEAFVIENLKIFDADREKVLSQYKDAVKVANSFTKQIWELRKITGATGKTVKVAAVKVDGLADSLEAAGAGAGAATDGLDGAKSSSDELADAMEGTLKSAVGSLSDAFANFVVRGFSDFKGFVKGIIGSFKNMLAQMISMAIKNRILISLGLGGSVAGGTASAGGAASAVTQGILGKVLGGGSALLGGILSGASSFVSTLFGAGGGLGTAATYLTGTLTTAASSIGAIGTAAGSVTSALGAVGGAIGAVAVPILAVVAAVALFKKAFGRTLKDGGITGNFSEKDGFEGQGFKYFKGGWFSSDKTATWELDQDTASGLEKAYRGVSDGIRKYVDVLGISAKRLEGFTFAVDIRTLGKSQEEVTQQINEQLTLAADGLSELALGTAKYTREGETASGTLARMAGSLQTVNSAFETLNLKLLNVSLAGADAASMLVDVFGGLENFTTATATYFDLFYSEQEKLAAITGATAKALAEFSREMPTTRDQYRQMIEAIDTTTESGREFFAVMVGLAGAFNTILPIANSLGTALSGIANTVVSEIDIQLSVVADMAQQSRAAASQWRSTAVTLRKTVRDMLGSNAGGTTGAQQLMANRNEFLKAMAAIKRGDMAGSSDLPKLSKDYLKSALSQAKTASEYATIAAKVRADLQLAAGISDLEGSQEDVLVSLYESQLDVLSQLKAYILSGNIDEDVLNQFGFQLGSLEEAIRAAELFSYDFLQERLNVTVDVIADADIPAHMRTLLENATNGIASTIDFLVRSDIPPDLKWLALQTESQLLKSVQLVVGQDLPNGVKRIALNNITDLDKTVNLIVGSGLPSDIQAIALAGSSELTRTMNVVLSRTNVDWRARKIALQNIGAYTAQIGAVIKNNRIGDTARRIILSQAGTYTAGIRAAINARNLTDRQRRILLRQQGEYIANIGATLANDKLTKRLKAIVLNSNTTAFRAVTVSQVWDAQLTGPQKDLLLKKSQRATRIVKAIIDGKDITGKRLTFLDRFADPTKRVRRVIVGGVNLDALSQQQKYLLEAVTGAVDGKLVLKGGFVFNPSDALEGLLVDSVKTPMTDLRSSLEVLADAVREDLNYRKSVMARDLKIADTTAKISELEARQSDKISSVTAAYKSFQENAAANGVELIKKDSTKPVFEIINGILIDNLKGLSGTVANITAFKNTDDYGKLVRGIWKNGAASLKRLKKKIRDQENRLREITGAVPAFATGGKHLGGVRIVGENGPEAEFTGPSRISSNAQTKKMFTDPKLARSVDRMAKEMEMLRDENRQLLLYIGAQVKKSADIERKWDIDGLPAERLA